MTHNDEAVGARPLRGQLGLRAARDELILRAAARLMRRVARGRLRLELPSGRHALIGPGAGVEATFVVRSLAVFWRAVRRASIGLGESYMLDEFETRDLGDLFRFYLDNQPGLVRAGGSLFAVRVYDRIAHRMRANSRAGSRRNIAAHYDLGNDFYAEWLDVGMTYSSALYRDPLMSLEEAQALKIETVLDAIRPAPGAEILEIGCGWGSLLEAAAARGCRVTGITLSREQRNYSERRLSLRGLGGATRIRLEDYRDVAGSFDHVVSIEMIEAVGEENLGRYFAAIRDRLRPGGTAVIQAITIDAHRYQRYRGKPDFIQAYIFPGGMLPTVGLMREHAEAAGLSFEPVTRFGKSYALTLREWRQRFERAWPRIAARGFDERFRRMWLYYLTYCEVGFERGAIDVGLFRLVKPSGPST